MSLAEFQSRSSTQGAAFEEIVCQHLTFMEGWTIIERHLVVNGLEVDIHAADPFGIEHWIECKGADGRSKRNPGLLDGTTAKVTVGVAWYLSRQPNRLPYIVWTSHLPAPDTNAYRIIAEALRSGVIDDVRTLGSVVSLEVGA